MNFETLLDELLKETFQSSLGFFSPELALSATIVGLLLVRLFNCDRYLPPSWLALIGALVAFLFAATQFVDLRGGELTGVWNSIAYYTNLQTGVTGSTEFFTGLLVYDQLTVFIKLFLLLFLVLVIVLTVLCGIPDQEDGPDFYTLLLGATIGMMIMSSSNHLLMMFLGIEMTSVPSYVMVGFLKGRSKSSEAALKYVVYGAGAAGVMLYGISLLCGLMGTAEMPEIAHRLQLLLADGAGISDATVRTTILAILMIFVGIAFKLSLVPFHFWCPDAFEGASAEVAGFLSVASKGAAFALLVRFVLSFVGDEAGALSQISLFLGLGLGLVAAVSATFGNLAAYTQTNIKRLLAYSTIAHAGYMLMAVSAMVVILNAPAGSGFDATQQKFEAARCVEGLLYYLCVYMFMNLGAFAIVALIRNQIFSEEIKDYAGLAQQSPGLCWAMLICLFSLIGIPPMGGFFAKLMIFASVFQAAQIHWFMWVVFAVGCLNTVLSLFYYLRILKAMFMEEAPEGSRTFKLSAVEGWYLLFVSVPILLLGTLLMNDLSSTTHEIASLLIP